MAKANKYADAARKAQQQTDAEYEKVVESLSELSKDKIAKLFPAKPDQDKLDELIALVNSATSKNEKIIKIKDNAQKFGAIVLKLVKYFV